MINIIAAITNNNGIGKDNKLLKSIPEDLKRFKKLTENNIVIMGMKTYESLPTKPLKNRLNIVITTKNIKLNGCIVVNSIEEALKECRHYKHKEIFVIGGGSIYKQFMDKADKLYITKIFEDIEADIFFPEIKDDFFITEVNGDIKDGYMFLTYSKKI